MLGPRLVADTGEWGTFAWWKMLLGIPGMRVAGGTDEVLRNIVSERVLGLPKEPGIDTTSPFKDLKVGTQTATSRPFQRNQIWRLIRLRRGTVGGRRGGLSGCPTRAGGP